MASALNIAWVAGRLRVFAAGELDLADERTLARVTDLLAEYTPEERAQIGAQAIEFGADALVVQGLMNLVGGEVIEVTGRPPRTRSWWWLAIVGGVAAVGVGVGAGLNARRKRRGVFKPKAALMGDRGESYASVHRKAVREADRVLLDRALAEIFAATHVAERPEMVHRSGGKSRRVAKKGDYVAYGTRVEVEDRVGPDQRYGIVRPITPRDQQLLAKHKRQAFGNP